MKKHITDEKTGISYTLHGDYYLPDLELPAQEEERPIGIWGAAASAVYPGASQGTLYQTVSRWEAQRLPCRSERAGRGYVLSAGK